MELRNAQSGPFWGRVIQSGTDTIAAFSTAIATVTMKRRPGERIWGYVFQVNAPAIFSAVVALPIKGAAFAPDEFALLLFNPFGADPNPLTIDWTAMGVLPVA